MDLSGTWRARVADDELRRSGIGLETDDSGWTELDVPGHWRDHPDLATSDGPVLYRRSFTLGPPGAGRRRWITLDGVFYQADVWLDGAYLGDPEGYFFPHTFDVTALSRLDDEHVLAVEVTCSPQHGPRGRRNITGVFQHDGIAGRWNPGGLWRRPIIFETGPVRIDRLRVICRDADETRAHLRLYARLDADSPHTIRLRTTEDGLAVDEFEHALAAGVNEIEWTIDVGQPALWWPRSLGRQHLTTIGVDAIVDGDVSDHRERRTGFREVAWNNWVCSINGERLFLKGANLLPTCRGLASASASDVDRDVKLALDAGLDAVRVHGHIADRTLYDAADDAGLLILQDFPLQWGQARNVRREAVSQAANAVNTLGHHPSIVLWSAHNDPMGAGHDTGGSGPRGPVRVALSQQVPTWNRSVLDRWVKRAFEKADPSRPAVPHSGMVPHLSQLSGTDGHWYFGWYHGEIDDLRTTAPKLPRIAQFISELGAQAVPDNAGFMEPHRWPDLDWERLIEQHGLQKEVFDARIPPADYPTFEAWRDATQRYQADLLRQQIEALRRLKYRPAGGFCVFALNDPAPAVSFAVLDHERAPKLAYHAVREACRPVVVVADPLPPFVEAGDERSLDIHVVNDTRDAIETAIVDVTCEWSGGSRAWRFAGGVGPDECVKVGTIDIEVPDTLGTLRVGLALDLGDGSAAITNTYTTAVTVPPAG